MSLFGGQSNGALLDALKTLNDRPDDVHVMPNDGRHICSFSCACRPREHAETKRLIAQGIPSARVIVHHEAN